MEGTPEEESLEATSENRHRGCGLDMLGQIVSSTVSSNVVGPITDGRQPCILSYPVIHLGLHTVLLYVIIIQIQVN